MKAKTAKKPLTSKQVMKLLKDAGSEQTRKVYRNHGGKGDLFGVSYATFKKLDKEIACNQQLAEELWATGNLDARIFACWKADADAATVQSINAWARDVDYHGLGFELAAFAAYTDLGAKISRKWRSMANEIRSGMGWRMLGTLAMQPDRPEKDGGVLDQALLDSLSIIEAQIHTAKNRTKQNMNIALYMIGCRATTSKAALAVAKRVGAVEVDQGNTGCDTLVAYSKIKDTMAKYKAKGKLPTDGAGGKRRRHC
jgi:3-methyladenine DNA glycosylase AlkD